MSQSGVWQGSGIRHIPFFSHLRALRVCSGGVVGHNALGGDGEDEVDQPSDEDDDPDTDDDGASNEGDAAREDGNASLSSSTRPEVLTTTMFRSKQWFLNRVAEITSPAKGGHFVTCSAMCGNEDCLHIWISKNDVFAENEMVFIETTLRNALLALSTALDDAVDEYWLAVVRHTSARISKYAADFHMDFKNMNKRVPCDQSLLNGMRQLAKLCKSRSEEDEQSLATIVTLAYELRKTEDLQGSLQALHESANKLHRSLLLLGRIRSIWLAICTAVPVLFSHVNQVEVRCLPYMQPQPIWCREPLDIEDVCGQNMAGKLTVRQRGEYSQWCEKNLEVHAEISMLYRLSGEKNVFPYLGGSKYCCYLCATYIRAYTGFEARRSHYSISPAWTIPEGPELLSHEMERHAKALQMVYADVQEELRSLPEKRPDFQAQSSLAMTTRRLRLEKQSAARIAEWEALKQAPANALLKEFERRVGINDEDKGLCDYCQAETTQKCAMCLEGWDCRECSNGRKYSKSHPTQCLSRVASSGRAPRRCVMCAKPTLCICRHCRATAWCSSECFERDRGLHDLLCEQYALKLFCRPLPPSTWVLAIHFCVENKIPSLAWIPIFRQGDSDEWYYKPDTGNLLGTDNPVSERTWIQRDVVGNFNPDRLTSIFARDAYLKDGSKRNQCIYHLCGSQTSHSWNGPMLAFRQSTQFEEISFYSMSHTDTLSFQNVMVEDLSLAQHFFSTYRERYFEDPHSTHQPRPGRKVKAVLINCDAAVETFGRNRLERVHLQWHPNMNQYLTPTPLYTARALGHDLLAVFQREPDQQWERLHNNSHISHIKSLFYIVDMRSELWGWIAKELIFEDLWSIQIYRSNHTDLEVETLYRLIIYSKTLDSLFRLATEGSIPKEAVMSWLNPRKFKEFCDEVSVELNADEFNIEPIGSSLYHFATGVISNFQAS